MFDRARAQRRNSKALSRSGIVGPAPILPGEDPAAYNELRVRVWRYLQPKDIIEEIFTDDVIDLTWQIIRMRRTKEGLIGSELADRVERGLRSVADVDDDEINALMKNWRAGKPSMKRIEEILSMADKTFDAILAHAFTHTLDQIERLDRLMTIAEARRNAVLRELERHRASFTERLRENIHQLEGGEFAEIESGPRAPKKASIKEPR
jgi:hypothetical protein